MLIGTGVIMDEIPENLHRFFWEYDPKTIRLDEHAHLIIWRLMERGTWEAMLWLRKTFSNQQLADFLRKKGKKVLPARELNYWALICGVPEETRYNWLEQRRKGKNIWNNRSAH